MSWSIMTSHVLVHIMSFVRQLSLQFHGHHLGFRGQPWHPSSFRVLSQVLHIQMSSGVKTACIKSSDNLLYLLGLTNTGHSR